MTLDVRILDVRTIDVTLNHRCSPGQYQAERDQARITQGLRRRGTHKDIGQMICEGEVRDHLHREKDEGVTVPEAHFLEDGGAEVRKR